MISDKQAHELGWLARRGGEPDAGLLVVIASGAGRDSVLAAMRFVPNQELIACLHGENIFSLAVERPTTDRAA
jgi:hypothetical protein